MTRILKTMALGLVALAGTLAVGAAQARSDVYWSVGISAPGYPVGVGATFSNAPVVYPRPVYLAPPPVVYAPPPVYYAPRPVYVRPAPVYYYYDYYEGDAYYHDYRDRKKRHRHPHFRGGR